MQMHKITLLILLMFAATSCSLFSDSDPLPTFVNADFAASNQVNPDVNDRPSPIAVRVYYLKNSGKFIQADFYHLFENYQESLGSDLLGTELLHLQPGTIQSLAVEAPEETKYVAVTAAFRAINHAVWRDIFEISLEQTNQLIVLIEQLNVKILTK